MTIDVSGLDGSNYRVSLFQWQAICYAMELADYAGADRLRTDGEGLESRSDCEALGNTLSDFLSHWDGASLTWDDGILRVNEDGKLVRPDAENARTPYSVKRENIENFVEFLNKCGGFNVFWHSKTPKGQSVITD